ADKISFKFQLLVDTSINVPPDNKMKFADFGPPAISVTPSKVQGGPPTIAVAYNAFAKNDKGAVSLRGVYVSDPAVAPPVRVVDTTKNIPGGGAFASFGFAPSIDGRVVAFFGDGAQRTGERGIYTSAPDYGTYTKVADQNTPIPDGNGNF